VPAVSQKYSYRNRILGGLDEHDINLIQPHLTLVDLTLRQRLEVPNRPVEKVYFVEQGLISIVANHRTSTKQVEVGLVGFEGMTGLAVVAGAVQSPHDTIMQSDGRAHWISAVVLRELLVRSATLGQRFALYAFAFQIQTAQTIFANAEGSIEQRLSRWLLMARDRLESEELRLTHETLSVMLGVRRPAVTIALQRLERNGLIATGRGVAVIQDVVKMTDFVDGLYGVPEAEYERLFAGT